MGTQTVDISFLTVPNLVTCSEVAIEWTYNGTAPPTFNSSLVVTNIGVSQGGLDRRVSPLVARQSTATVNTTLAVVDASIGKYDWPKVNIPQGWYRMDIYAVTEVVQSNIFNVTNGLDVSCVVPAPPSSPTPSSSSLSLNSIIKLPYPSTSLTNSPPISTSTPLVGHSSTKRRAIAGGVVGGVIVLALIAVVALWLTRRRRARTRSATPPSAVPRTKGQVLKGNHNPSDSTGAILPFGSGNRESSRQLSPSEEDFASEKSAVADDDNTTQKFPPLAVTRPHSRRPTSMVAKPSFESYESARPRPPSPSHSRYPPDRTRRASRKPVPVYDPNEFPNSELSDMPYSGPPEVTPGSGTKIYYIIPDAPLERRG